jgi:hypothetical protein
MQSRTKPIDHDPVRRAAIVAITCVGLQAAAPSGFATSAVAPYTLEELIASTQSIVIAKVHRLLFSAMNALDDFKPADEVKNPQIVVFDVSIKKVLAINPKPLGPSPVSGPAIVYVGSGATEPYLRTTPYPDAVGQEVILLLLGRRHSTSKDPNQPPIYQKANGPTLADRALISLDRLNDVLAAAFNAGFIQPST